MFDAAGLLVTTCTAAACPLVSLYVLTRVSPLRAPFDVPTAPLTTRPHLLNVPCILRCGRVRIGQRTRAGGDTLIVAPSSPRALCGTAHISPFFLIVRTRASTHAAGVAKRCCPLHAHPYTRLYRCGARDYHTCRAAWVYAPQNTNCALLHPMPCVVR